MGSRKERCGVQQHVELNAQALAGVGRSRHAAEQHGIIEVWTSQLRKLVVMDKQAQAQGLYYVLESDQLSETEKQWLLGGSLRKALHWSKPA
jgi:hypothetical protein